MNTPEQPEPLTRAAILKLEGDELSAAVIVAKGGRIEDDVVGPTVYNEKGFSVAWIEPGNCYVWHSGSRYRYATDWNAAGELLGLLIAAGYAVTTMHHSSAPDSPWHLTAWKQHPGPGPAMIQAAGPFPIMAARAFLLSRHNPQA